MRAMSFPFTRPFTLARAVLAPVVCLALGVAAAWPAAPALAQGAPAPGATTGAAGTTGSAGVTGTAAPAGATGTTASAPAGPAVPADPAADAAADRAVREWLAGKFRLDPASAAGRLDPLEAARQIVSFAPVPGDPRVSFDLRSVAAADGERRLYHYPLTSDAGDETLEVTLARSNGAWSPSAVQRGGEGSAIPGFVTGPAGAWLFLAITAALAYGVLAPTLWRRWLVEGWAVMRAHRGVFVFTNALLYGLFALGLLVGVLAPGVSEALQDVFSSALQQGGIDEALRGGVVKAAFGIAYFNFTNGAFLTTFLPGTVLGGLAYLINAVRNFVLSIALAPGVAVPVGAFLLHLPTIIVELQAYIFVTAGAGVLLARVMRGGFGAYGAALRDYLKVLPWAVTILVVAAWYEAFEILVLIPLLTGAR
jgi:hypothetical protein